MPPTGHVRPFEVGETPAEKRTGMRSLLGAAVGRRREPLGDRHGEKCGVRQQPLEATPPRGNLWGGLEKERFPFPEAWKWGKEPLIAGGAPRNDEGGTGCDRGAKSEKVEEKPHSASQKRETLSMQRL